VQSCFNGLQSVSLNFGMMKSVSLHALNDTSFERFCQMQTAGRLFIQRTLQSPDLVYHMTAYRVFRRFLQIL